MFDDYKYMLYNPETGKTDLFTNTESVEEFIAEFRVDKPCVYELTRVSAEYVPARARVGRAQAKYIAPLGDALPSYDFRGY